MWMLTLEKKNQLLKQRDEKMMELNILREKTPADLWREDLDAFSVKLDQVEEKERQEEAEMTKKATAAKAKVSIHESHCNDKCNHSNRSLNLIVRI